MLKQVLFGAAILCFTTAEVFAAKCSFNVCTESSEESDHCGSTLRVRIWSPSRSNGVVTHFNVRSDALRPTRQGNVEQLEIKGSGSFVLRRSSETRYQVQGCSRGAGAFGSSRCTPWVRLVHRNVRPLSGRAGCR